MRSGVGELHHSFRRVPQPRVLLEPGRGGVAGGLRGAGEGLDAAHVVLQRLGALVGLGGCRVSWQVLKRLGDGGQQRWGDYQAPAFHAAKGEGNNNVKHGFCYSYFILMKGTVGSFIQSCI